LTAIRESDSLSVAKHDERRLSDGDVSGAFSFSAMLLRFEDGNAGTHRVA
jgi:hypothetical protein